MRSTRRGADVLMRILFSHYLTSMFDHHMVISIVNEASFVESG